MMTENSPYKMSISLNVLNHLGINLYSNIPAVLSEIVANAWDADATEVYIDIRPDAITIRDNGNGMSLQDINDKYLNVGYTKRIHEPGLTRLGRAPMGRKGIGKLSVFSIAETAEVYTVRHGERNALLLDSDKIQKLIEDGKSHDYRPTPLPWDSVDIDKGTRIILRGLKRGVATTPIHLRKRLARRFSIIGAKHDFRVWIDGDEIQPKDRDYYKYVEFLWYFGAESQEIVQACKPHGETTSLRKYFDMANVVDKAEGYKVRGWIGTVDERKNIDEQNNTIVIFAHGKLIQEDILKDFSEGGVYARYLMGEIDADFMDLDDKDDIVTSDRQRVKEDDPRYKRLKEFVWQVLKEIQSKWRELRQEIGAERALEEPILKAWFDKLKGDHQRYAKQLFGKIESLKIQDVDAKREMYKASILAFEKLALKNSLSVLESLESEEDFGLMAKVFRDIDDLEAAHYYQIVRGRIDMLQKFEELLDADAKERLIQQHIFEHLWLLHPSWERATTNQRIEQSVTREFMKIDAGLSDEEKAGRIDIRYKTAAGKHIVIELKKYRRKVTIYALLEQLTKYRNALLKCLTTQFPDASHVVELICILGSPPDPQGQEDEHEKMLAAINARYITYDSLVSQTYESYKDYLEGAREMSAIIKIVDQLDSAFT
jgi:hypothetical protein